MIELIVNGVSLDIGTDNFTYTQVVNDISDLDTRQASYTNNFKAPKTKKNKLALDGLGLPSDASRKPYERPTSDLKKDGITIVRNGWVNIKETDEEYNIYIYDGIIDFFKAIENKTLGVDLDLDEINHEKSIDAIVNSQTNINYKYLIADYNGLTHYTNNSVKRINTDYLIPSASIKYLWDKIFEKIGFTYTGAVFNTEKFTSTYFTYPKAPPTEEIAGTSIFAEYTRGACASLFFDCMNWQNINTVEGTLLNNWKYIVPETATYKIGVYGRGHINAEYEDTYGNRYLYGFGLEIGLFKNGVLEHIFNGTVSDVYIYKNMNFSFGDIIELKIYEITPMPDNIGNKYFNEVTEIKSDSLGLKIEKYNQGISFSTELSEFKITDFVKEILNRFGLTAFPDKHSNNIDFLTLKERLQTSNVIDWSDKYVSRTSETYTSKYAQRNYFRYKYNDSESDYNDGFIAVQNINLDDTDDVFKSKTYSSEKELQDFFINQNKQISVNTFKIWDKEIKEEDGVQEIKYKPLNKRYHFLRANQTINTAEIGSEILNVNGTLNNLNIGEFSSLDFSTIIQDNYHEYKQILDDNRLHKIELELSIFDAVNVDFKALYYFKQEQQYYILNKLPYKGKETVVAEFIRVKYKS